MKRKYEIAVLSRGDYARTLRIYAPKKATRAIIMHDGQNVFYDEDASFKKSWRALDALKKSGLKDTAIIGIDSTPTRMDDYLPFPTELEKYGMPLCGGKADIYCDYIEKSVIPYLDKRFGFTHYAMLGSSAGATATLYFSARKCARVKMYGLFSTPLFVSPAAFDGWLKDKPLDGDASYYVYCGGSETEDIGEYAKLIPELYVDSAHILIKALRSCGAKNICARFNNAAVHDEICWRAPELEFFSEFAKI